MADISTYLQAIMDAVYGEDVRGSIHDAIDLINKVGEVTFTVGTAVTSQGSSITGYYTNSLYLNTDTDDLWKCDGTKWVLQGNIKGATGQTGFSPEVTIIDIIGGHAVNITDQDHPYGQDFEVMDGTDGTNGVSPAVTISTITGGHQVKITDADHPTGQTFNVMDGAGAAYINGDALVLT